jgi:hypothetical protein
MATYEISAPNGKTYQIDGPKGASDAQVRAEVLRQFPDAAAPRSSGLTARVGQAVADFVVPRDPSQPTLPQRVADVIVPRDPDKTTMPGAMWEYLKTPTGAGATIGTLLPTILSKVPHLRAFGMAANTPAGRTLGGGVGAAAGALIEGKDPLQEGAEAAGWNAVGEGVMGVGGRAVRSLPTVKGRIAEKQARAITDAIRVVSPELADVIGQNRNAVELTVRGPRTSAALQETALGGSGRDALSAAFERGMTEVDRLAPGATVNGPALQRAYAMMPALAQEQLVGPVGAGGFTPRQAQEILAWTGSKAFSEAPLGQGVGKVPQQRLWSNALNETVTGLRAASHDAAEVFVQTRAPYAGGMQYLDMLSTGKGGPFRSYGNRLNLDENAVRDFVSANRMELREKLGAEGWAALMAALGDAQPGTRSLMAPGGGGVGDALGQVYGRGQGGAPQVGGSLLRTILPNIGYQAAGRAPYTPPPYLQAILDVALQKAGGAALSGDRR